MKRGLFLLAGWLALVAFSGHFELRGAGEPSAEWVGLWRVIPEPGQTGLALHFSVATEKDGRVVVRHYSGNFFRTFEGRNLSISEGGLNFLSFPMSKEFRLTLELVGPGQARGTLELLHPQYPTSLPVRAFRVSPVNAWKPFNQLDRIARGRLIDVVELLSDGGGIPQSADEFERRWLEKVEPYLYEVIHEIEYGRSGGAEERSKFLRDLHALMGTESFRETTEKLRASLREAQQILEEKLSDVARSQWVLVLPSLGGEPDRLVSSQVEFLEVFAVDAPEVRQAEPERLRNWLCRVLLRASLFDTFPWVDTSVPARLIRDGLACHWLHEAGVIANPLDTLLSKPKTANGDSFREEALLSVARAIRQPAGAAKVDEASLLLVGYEFASNLGKVYSQPELRRMDRMRFAELLASFLNERIPTPEVETRQGQSD
ncbi:MAG: hypothetical protein Kow00109_22910 [Acidobacteriota bacterium]